LKEGDANSKLFHAVANGRRTKNYIAAVRVGEMLVTDHEHKNEVFREAYTELLGAIHNREHGIELQALDIPTRDLQVLDRLCSEEEVWITIREMPSDRVPGLDGFTCAFYQQVWPVIKHNTMAGLLKLGVGDGRGFGRLNRALITLIPKRQDAMEI
jgi:mannosylglycoprotein endo-beta-mannosidase